MKGLKCVLAGLALLFCFLPSAFSQEDAPQQESGLTLQELSSTISGKLYTLKDDLLSMNRQLEMLSRSLEQSESSQATLQEQLTSSYASLTSINEELTDCYNSIASLETKVSTRGKIVLVMGIVFAVMIALKIVGYILYAKGVSVPRWLDILI